MNALETASGLEDEWVTVVQHFKLIQMKTSAVQLNSWMYIFILHVEENLLFISIYGYLV